MVNIGRLLLRGVAKIPLLILMIFLVVPTFIIVAVSFGETSIITFPAQGFTLRWYEEVLASQDWLQSIQRSIVVGVIASLFAALAGTSLAYAAARGALTRGVRSSVDLLAIAPLAVPPVIIALGGYQMWNSMNLTGSAWLLIPLYALLGFPFVYLTSVSVIERLDPNLEMASASLGGGKVYTFFRVTLPVILPAVLTGTAFAFITTLDEVVLALFIAGGYDPTLPLQIFSKLSFGVSPDVAAVSALQIIVTLLLAAAAWGYGRWKAHRIQREKVRLSLQEDE